MSKLYGAVPEVHEANNIKSAYGVLKSDEYFNMPTTAAPQRGPSPAPSPTPTPPPPSDDVTDWIELTHAASGRKYYQSAKLKQTTWNKPAQFRPGKIRAPPKANSPPPAPTGAPTPAPAAAPAPARRSTYMALPSTPTPAPPTPAPGRGVRDSGNSSDVYGTLELLPPEAPDAFAPPPFMADAAVTPSASPAPPTAAAAAAAAPGQLQLPARPGQPPAAGRAPTRQAAPPQRGGQLQMPALPPQQQQQQQQQPQQPLRPAVVPRVVSPGLDQPMAPPARAIPGSPQPQQPGVPPRGPGANPSRLRRKDRIDNISQALHHGFLFKKGKRRWFVLRGAMLYWFVVERPVVECTQEYLDRYCCNKLDLMDYALFEAEMRVTDVAAGVEQTAFTLEPLDSGGAKRVKAYQLRAQTGAEWRLWMDKLEAALASIAKAAANQNALLIQQPPLPSGSFRKSSGATHACTVIGCGKEYFNEKELADHMQSRHAAADQSATFNVQADTLIFRCPVCAKAYITERDLQMHHKLRHNAALASGVVRATRARDDDVANGVGGGAAAATMPMPMTANEADAFASPAVFDTPVRPTSPGLMMPPPPLGAAAGEGDMFAGDERRYFAGNVDLRQFRWFHGNLSAATAYKRLATQKKHSYLVRTGSRSSGFVISWVSEEMPLTIIHSVVNELDGGVWQMTGDQAVYASLMALLEGFGHMMKFPVFA